MLLIRPNGEISLVAEGTKITVPLNVRRAPAFKADGFNRLQIVYDIEKNTLSAKVNGEVVVAGFDLAAAGFTPEVAMAGFLFNTTPRTLEPQGQVDNFKVTVR